MKHILLICCSSFFVYNISQVQEKEMVPLSGYIKYREGLIGATFIIEELKVGAASNIYGFYSIRKWQILWGIFVMVQLQKLTI